MEGFEHGLEWERREARAQGSSPGRMVAESTTPDGAPWSQVFRIDGGYVLRFPGLADFEITADGSRVRSWPSRELEDETIRDLYLNHVVPLALSRAGLLVFHASAVEIDGEAVAFLGESGRGKSTLAAAFATRGSRFLSDDGLLVDCREDGFWILPNHPSIRLWDDSREALIPAGRAAARANAKERLRGGEHLAFCGEPRRLRALYFLGEGMVPALSFGPMSGQEMVMGLLHHAFLLDPEDRSPLADHFERTAALARAVAGWRLDFPNDLQGLGAITRAIVAHARGARAAA